MMKIKQNDEVIVIAGKDKGSIGTVTKILGSKLIVEGFNLAKKTCSPKSTSWNTRWRRRKRNAFKCFQCCNL